MPPSNTRQINGVEITGTPTPGDIPVATSATTAEWAAAAVALLTGAVILAPAASNRNVMESTGDFTTLTLKANAAQTTKNLTEWLEDDGTTLIARMGPSSSGNGFTVFSRGGGAAITADGTFGSGGSGIHAFTDFGFAAIVGQAFGNGKGVEGFSEAGNSGYFQSYASTNSAATLVVRQKGASTAHLVDFVDDAGVVQNYIDYQGILAISGGFSPNKVIRQATNGNWDVHTTITAALAVASPGDCIWVGPGSYNEKNLLRNGVNQWYAPGAIVDSTATTNGAVFDDSSTGAGGAVTCTIGGFGVFRRSGNGGTHRSVVYSSNNSSDIHITCDLIDVNGGSGTDGVTHAGNGTLSVKMRRLDQSNTCQTLIVIDGNGKTNIEVDEVGPNSNAADILTGVGGGRAIVDIKFIGAGKPITWSGSGDLLLRIGINTSLSTKITNASSGNMAVELGHNMTGNLGSDIRSIVNSSTGTQTVQLGGIRSQGSTTGTVVNSGAGTQIVYAKQILTQASISSIVCSAGTQVVSCPDIQTTSGSDYAVKCTGGKQRLLNCRATNTGTNGIAAMISGGTQIWEGGTLISHSGASDSIYAASAQDVTIYGTPVANKPLNGIITQRVGTITVDTTYVV